jgi:hypothetical protein
MRPIDADYLESKVHRVGNESGSNQRQLECDECLSLQGK